MATHSHSDTTCRFQKGDRGKETEQRKETEERRGAGEEDIQTLGLA
jgi:hypothetical protein